MLGPLSLALGAPGKKEASLQRWSWGLGIILGNAFSWIRKWFPKGLLVWWSESHLGAPSVKTDQEDKNLLNLRVSKKSNNLAPNYMK